MEKNYNIHLKRYLKAFIVYTVKAFIYISVFYYS